MKKNGLFLLAVAIALTACRSKNEVLPSQIWSENCVELTPEQDGYRLSGECCEYAVLPALKINKKGAFSVEGTHHSFIGAGYNTIPIRVRGQVAEDKSTLTLRYSVNTLSKTYTFKPGPATIKCDCYCD